MIRVLMLSRSNDKALVLTFRCAPNFICGISWLVSESFNQTRTRRVPKTLGRWTHSGLAPCIVLRPNFAFWGSLRRPAVPRRWANGQGFRGIGLTGSHRGGFVSGGVARHCPVSIRCRMPLWWIPCYKSSDDMNPNSQSLGPLCLLRLDRSWCCMHEPDSNCAAPG